MTDPVLPRFDVPELHNKVVDPRVIEEWIAENVRSLKESGQLASIRIQAWRQPSPVRFTLRDRLT